MRLHPTLLRKACRSSFDPRAEERGRAYAEAGQVDQIDWDPESLSLQGVVLGNFSSTYKVTVELLEEADGVRLDSECTCPVGFGCKHGVALVYRLIADLEASKRQQTPLDQWQETIDQFHPDAPIRPAADQSRCMVYELSIHRETDHTEIQLDLATARRLKKGGLGKRTPLSGYNALSPANQAIQNEIDRNILRLVNATRTHQVHTSVIRVDGDVGVLLLTNLVDSGRCFLRGEGGPPLRFGPPVTPTFDWLRSDAGYELVCDLDGVGDDWLCTPTLQPWYIDPAAFIAGPIRTTLNGALLGRALMMPPLPESDARVIARRLLLDPDLGEIPQPVALDIQQLEGVEPTPRLTLVGAKADDALASEMRYFGRIEACYEEHVLPHFMVREDASVLVAGDAEEVLISRDIESEVGWVERLRGEGFKTATLANDYCAFPDRSDDPAPVVWQQFLEHGMQTLEREGWEVIVDPSFSMRFVEADSFDLDAEDQGNGWFDVSMEIEIEGRKLSLLPLLIDWLETGQDDLDELLAAGGDTWVRYDDEQYVRLPVSVLRPVLSTLVELLEQTGTERDSVSLSQHHAPLLLELRERLDDDGVSIGRWEMPGKLREVAERLRDFRGIEPVALPSGLNATLRDYQKQGLDWLQFLRGCGFGGVLADDMGLGKTVQVLANLLVEKEAGRLDKPSLIVMPTSLISNWRREVSRFTPELSVLVLHGLDRHELFDQIEQHDLVLTTYSLLPRDHEALLNHPFYYIVLDESQWIKNARTRAARVAGELSAEHRLCVTGTPLENNLGEVWSQFHFLMPGFLGNQEAFNKRYRHPIERRGDMLKSEALARRLAPFILRRTKQAVAAELPEKIEMESLVSLGPQQAALYEAVRATMEKRVRDVLQRRGLAQSHITILDALLKLRQVCCDPRLVKLEQAAGVEHSAKLGHLMEILPEMLAEGRKVLLFSQFTSMLALIESELVDRDISFSVLTGQTRRREEAIAAFQEGGAEVFLISLKAGGVGLNLTAADTVILYDPWWNPAVERQAIDRAHRIGQDKNVFVYRLIVEHSIEQKILAMQSSKQRLADNLIDADEGALKALEADDILGLFTAQEDD